MPVNVAPVPASPFDVSGSPFPRVEGRLSAKLLRSKGCGGRSGKLVNALTCRAQIYLETGRSGDANPPQRIDCVLGKGPWCHLHAKFTGRMQATAVFPQLVRSPNARKLPCPGETR